MTQTTTPYSPEARRLIDLRIRHNSMRQQMASCPCLAEEERCLICAGFAAEIECSRIADLNAEVERQIATNRSLGLPAIYTPVMARPEVATESGSAITQLDERIDDAHAAMKTLLDANRRCCAAAQQPCDSCRRRRTHIVRLEGQVIALGKREEGTRHV